MRYIYSLIDPITSEIRYIGATRLEIEERLSNHIKNAQKGISAHCYHWIRLLLEFNLKPKVELLENVNSDNWQERESFYIKSFRDKGFNLTNMTDGGDGISNMSDEIKQKISQSLKGNKLSDETKKKISNKLSGRILSESHKEKVRNTLKGRKHTQERINNMSIGRSGIKHDDSTKKKISDAFKSGKCDNTEARRAGYKNYIGRKFIMSHVATISLEIKDLECLKKAGEKLGLKFSEHQKTYRWYGTHIGDYPLPEGMSKEELGTCDHTLSIPDNTKAYEIGIRKSKNHNGYDLLYDFWNGGYGLIEKIGENGVELKKEYSAQVAEKHLRKQGFRPVRKVEGNRILITGVR